MVFTVCGFYNMLREAVVGLGHQKLNLRLVKYIALMDGQFPVMGISFIYLNSFSVISEKFAR